MKKLFILLFPFIVFANEYIFAASWQDGFCATHPQKYECKDEYKYFTIHGLWPKNKNCHTNKKLKLPPPLWKNLKIYMPSNYLIKHEWKKHGICYSKDPIIYFSDNIYLIQQIIKILNYFLIKIKIKLYLNKN